MLYKIKKTILSFFKNSSLGYRKILHRNFSALDKKILDKVSNGEQVWSNRNCLVCNNSNFQKVFIANDCYDYVRCNNCEMVQMEPIPNSSMLDELYNSEEISYNASGSEFSNIVKPIGIIDRIYILKSIQTGKHLDIGSGVGGFLKTMSSNFDSEGLEVNKIHSSIGINNGLKIHNMYSSQFAPTSKYDIITMLQVIEHLPDPKSVILDVKRLLKPGGLFYVACPNFESISFKLFGEKHRHVSTFGHLNLFSPKTLSEVICQEGFELLEAETYNADVKLHDLFYYYLLRRRFSHRYSGYNPFTYALFEFIGNPLYNFFENHYVKKKNMGSYNRAIFRLKN